jgi:ADP-ribose pyrophosphatase
MMNITRLSKLTDERWLNLFAADFEHNGHVGRWVFASRKAEPHQHRGNDAVVIVPILRNPGEAPRLVAVREFRVPVGDYVIGLPAGLIEEGEPIEEAIRRELLEETGLELVRIDSISPPLLSSSGMTDEAAAMAFVEVRGGPDHRPSPEASEDIQVLLLDQADLVRICSATDVHLDVKAWLVFWFLLQRGTIE